MSLKLIEEEINVFLSSSTPEILCINGKWGVGKTYGWKKLLNSAKDENKLALSRYSYVSLFGINSLDDLRFAVFESTVSGNNIGNSPDLNSFSELFAKGTDLARKGTRTFGRLISALGKKDAAEALLRSAFLSVNSQLVCIDDIERAGIGLDTRDILGLASFLKEERKCKVVLLLNDEELENDSKIEFDSQLEKVADVSLTFDLASSDAAKIALTGEDHVISYLTSLVVQLGIVNIRVIKKIERLAIRLAAILDGHDKAIIEQGLATLALGGWSVHQPNEAPTLDFIRTHNRLLSSMRRQEEEIDEETKRHLSAIEDYPFEMADQLDLVILRGVEAGYFLTNELCEAADQISANSGDAAFTRAWEELYHGSLTVDDDIFLDELFRSAVNEADAISPLNINSAICLLRENGRDDQANEIIQKYISSHEDGSPGFFEIDRHHFSPQDHIDEGLREAFANQYLLRVDERDPLDVLKSMGEKRGWDNADAQLMARQTADNFEVLFETLQGSELRRSVETLLLLGNSNQVDSEIIQAAAVEALQNIAEKSPLRRRKVERFGIELPVEAK